MMRRTFPVVAALLLVAAAVCPCTLRAAEPYEVEFQSDVQYGTGAGQPLRLNLARPKGVEGPLPVLVYIHGGAWAAGNKNDLSDAIRQAAGHGYLAVSVAYRFAPEHVFPAQVEDCKCAVRWLRAHAEELSIDPQRFGAVGFSAGAHLSMMLGVMDPADGLEGDGGWPDQSSKVQAVVQFFGPTDLELEYPEISRGLVARFIGGTVDEKRDAYRRASPVRYVDAADAPMLMFQGTKDVLVPYEQAYVMAGALSETGVPGRVELLIGANHGWGGNELGRTLDATFAFFDDYLRPDAAGQ